MRIDIIFTPPTARPSTGVGRDARGRDGVQGLGRL